MRGYLDEARMRLDAMDAAGWTIAPALRGRLVEALGGIAYWQADYAAAARFYAEELDLWRRVGDDNEIANAIYNLTFTEILPLMQGTGGADYARDNGPRLVGLCEEALALFRRNGNRAGEGNVIWGLGGLLYFLDRAAEAEPRLRETLPIFREVNDRRMEAWALHMLALVHLRLGRPLDADADGRAALSIFHAAGDLSGIAMVLGDLALTATKTGDRQRAGRLHGIAQRLHSATGAALTAQVDRMTGLSIDAVLTPEEIAAYGAEGARLSVDEAVRYATS
jgi:tetratricopeptide (TPR) repeat protein